MRHYDASGQKIEAGERRRCLHGAVTRLWKVEIEPPRSTERRPNEELSWRRRNWTAPRRTRSTTPIWRPNRAIRSRTCRTTSATCWRPRRRSRWSASAWPCSKRRCFPASCSAWPPCWFPKCCPTSARLSPRCVRTTVRGAYVFGQKTKEMVAEAQEHVNDIVAEVHAESEAAPSAPATVKSTSATPAA